MREENEKREKMISESFQMFKNQIAEEEKKGAKKKKEGCAEKRERGGEREQDQEGEGERLKEKEEEGERNNENESNSGRTYGVTDAGTESDPRSAHDQLPTSIDRKCTHTDTHTVRHSFSLFIL